MCLIQGHSYADSLKCLSQDHIPASPLKCLSQEHKPSIFTELSCVNVEAAVLGSLSLMVLTVSMDVNQH